VVTGLIYSRRYLGHDPGPGHPERPERLRAIVEALREAGYWGSSGTEVIEPSPASPRTVELVHDPKYIELVRRLSKAGDPIDSDTPTRPGTYEIALLAAGGAVDAGRRVTRGELSNAFALLRPPGHHASRSTGGGFCYFNNVAVMVEVLKREHGLKRILILDLDAHHGNGSQNIFYEDPSVLYISIHQDGRTLYPGTGFVEEVGSGEGEGYNVNVPLPPGSSDEDYASAMHELFVPLSEQFEPELVAVSMGFDAYAGDPLTQLRLSSEAYSWLAGFVAEQAERLCGGKAVFVLEGGYVPEVLGKSVVDIVRVLQGEMVEIPPKPPVSGGVKKARDVMRRYWEL